MKRIASGIIAVVVAVAAFAFTKADKKSPLTSFYWFQTQNNGTVIDATSVPPFQSTDPFGCTSGVNGCSKAYDSYHQLGPNDYAPAGTLEATHKKP
jgi:hypothetical protein